MTERLFISPIYPITDTRLSGLSHAEQVRMLVAGGARLIQLREKHLSPKRFYEDAREALKIARASGASVVINDRVDIAMMLDADGVHLGQTDLAPERARKLLGREKLIGFSTHSVSQAIDAITLDIDYIAIGPVFETGTKENPDPVVGLKGVEEVRAAVGGIPLVAIGGIKAETAPKVFNAGADSLALVSEILTSPLGITAAYKALAEAAERQVRS